MEALIGFPSVTSVTAINSYQSNLLKSSSSDGHETKRKVPVSSPKLCSSNISHQVP
ncbi:hypothetical protein YC2023_117818 [Brassica napus]